VSTLLHATVCMFFHNLLNILIQIAYKMGLQKNIDLTLREEYWINICLKVMALHRLPLIRSFFLAPNIINEFTPWRMLLQFIITYTLFS
jgi:hypothetical protein